MGLLGTILLAIALVALGASALLAFVLWRVSYGNTHLEHDPSPRGHWLTLLRHRWSPQPVTLACIPTASDTGAVVTWVTRDLSPTEVRYGGTDGELLTKTVDPTPTNHHRVTLTKLDPDTTYRVHLSGTPAVAEVPLAFTTRESLGDVRFRFATITDTHFKRDARTWPDGRLYGHSLEVHERLLRNVVAHRPDFILHKGDCTEPTGKHRFTRYGEFLRKFNIPMHFIPGNHDYLNHPAFVEDWERMTGHRTTWRSFSHDGVHFVLLDSCWTGEQERGFLGATQLRWLRDDLAAHRELPTVVAVHHPIFGTVEENRVCHDADAFHAVARAHPRLCAVLSGHVHRNLVRWSDDLPGVPNIETASGIQYPIGYALYDVCEGGIRQTFHTIDDVALNAESWSRSWLRSVTNPSDPMGRAEHRNFTLPWPSGTD